MSTKIHLALSPEGTAHFVLSPGQRTDMVVFPKLRDSWPWSNLKYVIADKGYETYEVRKAIKEIDAIPVIPPKANRVFPGTYDKKLYKTRCKIEHFFAHLKEYKRVATRFDKLDPTFAAFTACAILIINNLLC